MKLDDFRKIVLETDPAAARDMATRQQRLPRPPAATAASSKKSARSSAEKSLPPPNRAGLPPRAVTSSNVSPPKQIRNCAIEERPPEGAEAAEQGFLSQCTRKWEDYRDRFDETRFRPEIFRTTFHPPLIRKI
jgi:hypothetical protein